ncbi:MAG: metal-dependent hydrolase [Methanomicrobiales archaeon]|nr:metal-dependent hydrolase [Methanomicrobiales archaeon]
MDSLTHGIAIGLLFFWIGMHELILWGVVGAVILDFDVLFIVFSDSEPSLFIFSHGGVTHSIVGAVVVSVTAFLILRQFLTRTSIRRKIFPRFPELNTLIPEKIPFISVSGMVAGALLHLGLDCCASPGLPLLYPFSIQKFTLGMLPGSTMLLFLVSLAFIMFLIRGRITWRQVKVYSVIFLVILLFSAGMKGFVAINTEGRSIPTLNPFSWLIVKENGGVYTVDEYSVLQGVTNRTVFEKYRNVTQADLERYEDLPALERVQYFSYITIAERSGDDIMFYDPLRKQQIIWYPPYYSSVRLSG